MNITEFVDTNPTISLVALFLIMAFFFKGWNRLMRMLNIRKNGWPPAHCNADGDFKVNKSEDN